MNISDHTSTTHCSFAERVALWSELLDACDQLLLAGLRRQVGPDGDIAAAYRAWHTKQLEEHDKMMRHLMEELNRRAVAHGN